MEHSSKPKILDSSEKDTSTPKKSRGTDTANQTKPSKQSDPTANRKASCTSPQKPDPKPNSSSSDRYSRGSHPKSLRSEKGGRQVERRSPKPRQERRNSTRRVLTCGRLRQGPCEEGKERWQTAGIQNSQPLS